MCEGGPDPYGALREQLIGAGLLIPSSVRGVYGRSGVFEAVTEGLEALVTRAGVDQHAEVMRFPPVFPRAAYAKTNHAHNFPDLLGSVHTFTGARSEHVELVERLEAGEDWTRELAAAEVMLIPAACYPLYPTATGVLPEGGRTVDLRSYVFRHEPSDDPARMQIFRQREYVRLGTADEAETHRDLWLGRAEALLKGLGLPVERVLANDPFFGRGGRLAKATQREQALKYELVVPVANAASPTAISSANCHLDAFGVGFDIRTPDGEPAHTACIGFGLERCTLALFATHGLDPDRWSLEVREQLGLA